jgi:hypothetical protein
MIVLVIDAIKMTQMPAPSGKFRLLIFVGGLSAIIGLFFFPEIFEAIAILLGAYTWRNERGMGGLYLIIVGIAFMILGIYYTSYYSFANFIY